MRSPLASYPDDAWAIVRGIFRLTLALSGHCDCRTSVGGRGCRSRPRAESRCVRWQGGRAPGATSLAPFGGSAMTEHLASYAVHHCCRMRPSTRPNEPTRCEYHPGS